MFAPVFAVLAAICFLLAFFKVHVDDWNLVTLGLFFIACHLIFVWSPYVTRRGDGPRV